MKQFLQIQQLLKILSGASRLQILLYLQRNKSKTVNEIAESLMKRQFTISRDLRILRSAQLVEFNRRGKYVSYRLPLKIDPILKAILKEIK